jgi:hypothetical protein
MELGIRLSFVKTKEFRGRFEHPNPPHGSSLSVHCSYQDRWASLGNYAKSNVLLEIRLSGLFTSCFCSGCAVHHGKSQVENADGRETDLLVCKLHLKQAK